jgi:hypothetical protein
MNRELLRYESEHVKAEHDKLRDHVGVMERAVEIAALRFARSLTCLSPDDRWALYDELPGYPPPWDAPEAAWVGYFVGEAALALEQAA